MINNRQNGRRRGRGGGNGPGGGGNGPRQGGGRPDNGNRIDNRARGNANQLYEKYKNLASDAQRQGDRVNTEYYLQFADHYFRVLSESRSRFEDQQPRRQQNDAFDEFEDGDDYGDEGEPIRAGEQAGDDGRQRDGGQRDGGQRNGNRDAGYREGNYRDGGNRDAGQRDAGQRDGGNRDGYQRDGRQQEPRSQEGRQQEGRQLEGRQQEGRQQEGRSYEGSRRNGAAMNGGEGRGSEGHGGGQSEERYQRAPAPVANDVGDETPGVIEPAAAKPRRGRGSRRAPAAEGEVEAAPVAIEADRLPPSLGVTAESGDEPDQPKPRRRRLRTGTGEAPQAAE